MSVSPVLAVHRFGLGARPNEIEQLGRDPIAALLAQVKKPDTLSAKGLSPSHQVMKDHHAFRTRRNKIKKMKAAGEPVKDMKMGGGSPTARAYRLETGARWQQYQETNTPFAERLTMFWSNHFAVSGRQNRLGGLVGAYEREAIRPHINGNFGDMLIAVAQHPAMLVYLNNAESIGPNSLAGKRQERGLNENLARELLELHTLGVEGGYQIKDIQALAKGITGWSVGGPKAKGLEGKFQFKNRAHEPGGQLFLGDRYISNASTKIGEDMLMRMARHPSTALFIAGKLARYFVSDTPSDDLVKTIARAFYHSEGALMPAYEAMLRHPDAWAQANGTFKPPIDFVASALRSFDAELSANDINQMTVLLGQRMWHVSSPQGYKTDQKTWVTSDSLKTRVDVAVKLAGRIKLNAEPMAYAENILDARLRDETKLALRRAADTPQAIAIMLMAPEFQRR